MSWFSILRVLFLALIGRVEVRDERKSAARPAPLRVPVEPPSANHHPLVVDGMGFFVRASYDEARALQQRANAQLVLRAVCLHLGGCGARQEAPCELS